MLLLISRILLICLSSLLLPAIHAFQVTLTPPNTVNTVAPFLVTQLATYTLTFAQEFDLSGVTASSCTTNSQNLQIHSCVVDTATRQIQMSLTIGNNFFFQIKDVKNPPLAGSYQISGLFQYQGIDISGSAQVEVQPFTMNAIALSSSADLTNTLAHLTVTMDTSSALASGDKFRLILSEWYSPIPSYHYITVSSPVCSFSISGGSFQTASSCSYTQATFTLEAGLPGAVPADDQVDLVFKVQNFRTPPTTESVGSDFKAYLLNQGGTILEQKLSGISLSVTQPNESLPTQIFMSPNTVGTPAQYQFLINPDYYPAHTQLQITFPSEISFTDANQQNLFINVVSSTQDTIEASQSGQLVTLTSVTSVQGTASLHFFLSNALNPQTQTPSSPFQVLLLDRNSNKIFKSSTTTVTAQAMGISEASVSAVTPTVGSLSNYVITFKAASTPPSDGSIVLVFPADVQIQQSPSCYTSQNINAATTCSFSGNQVTLSSPFESGYTHGSDVRIGISHVLNPSSVKPTALFQISLYTASGAKIQSTTTSGGASVKFTATVATLSSFSISSSSSVTTTNPVILQFSFVSPGLIASGSIFTLTVPSDIPILKGHDSASTCQSVANLSTISCTYTTPDFFRVQDGFASSVAGGTTLSFSLSSLTNPRSTLTTSPFSLSLMNSASYASYSGTASLTLTQAVQFTNARVKSTSSQNGFPNPYTFWLTSPATVLTTDFIRVTLPSGIQFSSSSLTCTGQSPLAPTLTCALQNSELYIAATRADGTNNEISAGQEISFTVSDIINQPGIGTSSSLSLAQVIQSSGLYYQVGIKTSNLTVVTSQEASFSTLTVTPTDARVGATTSYIMSFISPVNPIPAGSSIDITFPPEITLPSSSFNVLSCTGSGGLANTPTCAVVNGNIVRITNGFPADTSNTQINATIGGITNGATSTSPSQSFSLKFLTGNGDIIASSSSISPVTFSCSSPCASCSTTSTTCTSCDTSSTFPYYLSTHSTCYDECPDSFFNTQSFLCGACSTNCATCTTTATTCTSCVPGSSLPNLFNNACLDQCPDKTYPISNECEPCSSPCLTCGARSTQCLTCDATSSSPYLLNNDCLPECTDGYVAGANNICQQCQHPCSTCSNVPTQCTGCQTGYLESNTCVDSCSSNFALNESGTQCLPVTPRRDQVLYFVFLAVFAIIIVTLLIVRCYLEFVKFWTSAIALGSLVEIAVWFFMLYFLWRDDHLTSFTIVGIALFFHYLTNLVLLCCYCRLLHRDGGFNHYRDKYKCTVGWVLATSILSSHKFFRLLGSFLFHQDKLNVYLSKQSRWVRLISLISVTSMLLTTLPILFACGFNIFYNTVHLQLFYTDIEVAIITLTLWIFQIIEVRYERTNLTEEIIDKRKKPGAGYRERPELRLNTFDDDETTIPPSRLFPYFADISVQRVRDQRATRSEGEVNQGASLPRQRRASFPPSPRTEALALAVLMKDKQHLPTPPFDASGITGEGEISADVPISIPGGDISFTEKRPGKIRDTMHVNATPNRLNAAETQGPDEQDLKYQTPVRNREPPELYMNEQVVVVRDTQNEEYFEDLEAHGVVPRLVESNQSVDYYSASDIEIDMIDKSTERQLMGDMSGFEAFRRGG